MKIAFRLKEDAYGCTHRICKDVRKTECAYKKTAVGREKSQVLRPRDNFAIDLGSTDKMCCIYGLPCDYRIYALIPRLSI